MVPGAGRKSRHAADDRAGVASQPADCAFQVVIPGSQPGGVLFADVHIPDVLMHAAGPDPHGCQLGALDIAEPWRLLGGGRKTGCTHVTSPSDQTTHGPSRPISARPSGGFPSPSQHAKPPRRHTTVAALGNSRIMCIPQYGHSISTRWGRSISSKIGRASWRERGG